MNKTDVHHIHSLVNSKWTPPVREAMADTMTSSAYLKHKMNLYQFDFVSMADSAKGFQELHLHIGQYSRIVECNDISDNVSHLIW